MPGTRIVVSTPVKDTPRVLQLRGLFDIPAEKTSQVEWDVSLPLEEKDWQIGLIVGPSGSGKSTISRELWDVQTGFQWPEDQSVVDGFPKAMGIKKITGLLSSVGFSSPPSWLRPYRVLSTGEKFRVDIARALAESEDLVVIDEFTSVVDRTVAQIGSAAIAKAIRRSGNRFIAVTCHEDIEAWLQPDWIYRPATNEFTWGCLHRRPAIVLSVSRVSPSAWTLFRHHHYLDSDLHKSATCFGAWWEGQLVAFSAWLPLVGKKATKRATRTVCLPDYQGVGIGNALVNHAAEMWAGLGITCKVVSAHPALINSRNRSPLWAMTRQPSWSSRSAQKFRYMDKTAANRRLVTGFRYVGPAM